jgi:hypothetical protein
MANHARGDAETMKQERATSMHLRNGRAAREEGSGVGGRQALKMATRTCLKWGLLGYTEQGSRSWFGS